ncbi:MAG TPA: hypothetical protein VK470_18770 [Bacteroidota bacterium]|nr:hypothetical protein [Bacteroidota bacterium]
MIHIDEQRLELYVLGEQDIQIGEEENIIFHLAQCDTCQSLVADIASLYCSAEKYYHERIANISNDEEV